MSGVVTCAVYAGGRRVADISLEDISEVLKQDDERLDGLIYLYSQEILLNP